MTRNQMAILTQGFGVLKPSCRAGRLATSVGRSGGGRTSVHRKAIKAERKRALAAAEIERLAKAQQLDKEERERRAQAEAQVAQEEERRSRSKRQARR